MNSNDDYSNGEEDEQFHPPESFKRVEKAFGDYNQRHVNGEECATNY